MIVPSQAVKIVVATRPVDFRKGHDGLAAVVQNELGLDPHSGIIVVFRAKRGDRIKVLLWDGSGLVLACHAAGAGQVRVAPDQRRGDAAFQGAVRGAVRGARLAARSSASGAPAHCGRVTSVAFWPCVGGRFSI